VTIFSVALYDLLIDTIKNHRESIFKNKTLLALYFVMAVGLGLNLANVWIDPAFFCIWEFKYDDKLELLNAYIILLFI
jgi:hypothetical protein